MWNEGKQHTLERPLVTTIDGEFSLIDGHSRVFVALEQGVHEINVEFQPLEDIEGSTALYLHIHRTGPHIGIHSISDLADRIVSAEMHKKLWMGYCENWLIQNRINND